MIWRNVTLTLTAWWLITLPFQSIAGECDEQSWNQALKTQASLDKAYNHHAQRFNQFLPIHTAQPFLYEEFTQNEIVSLWQQHKPELQQKMLQQITASEALIIRMQIERQSIVDLLIPTQELQQRWLKIHQDCLKREEVTNAHYSQRFSDSAKQLYHQLNSLLYKLNALKARYQKEINTLQKAKEATDNR